MTILIPLLGAEKFGGIRVLCDVSTYMQNKGFSVIFIVLNSDRLPFTIHPQTKIIPVYFLKEFPHFKLLKIFYFTLALLFIGCKANAIISNYYITSYISFLYTFFNRKCQHIYYVQAYEPNWFSNPIIKNIVILSYKIPSKIIVVAKWIGEKIHQSSGKSYYLISNCINHSIFYRREMNKNDKIIISLNGTWAPLKGFTYFLEASPKVLKINDNINFNIITSQEKFKIPEEYKKGYSILRPKDDNELAILYSISTIFINPAIEEGFGLPSLEAMACGIPIITTDNGGCRDYAIHMHNSIIVKPGDVDALVESVLMLLADERLRQKLSENAIITAKKFNWADKLTPLLEILNGN